MAGGKAATRRGQRRWRAAAEQGELRHDVGVEREERLGLGLLARAPGGRLVEQAEALLRRRAEHVAQLGLDLGRVRAQQPIGRQEEVGVLGRPARQRAHEAPDDLAEPSAILRNSFSFSGGCNGKKLKLFKCFSNANFSNIFL